MIISILNILIIIFFPHIMADLSLSSFRCAIALIHKRSFINLNAISIKYNICYDGGDKSYLFNMQPTTESKFIPF